MRPWDRWRSDLVAPAGNMLSTDMNMVLETMILSVLHAHDEEELRGRFRSCALQESRVGARHERWPSGISSASSGRSW